MDDAEATATATYPPQEEQEQAMVTEEEVVPQEETESPSLSQPQVIVERIEPDDSIIEEEDEVAVAHQTNGTANALNDIIADAVEGVEDEVQNTSATAAEDDSSVPAEENVEVGEEAPPATNGADTAAAEEEPKKSPEVDRNQCRTCTSRENLQNIFEPLKEDTLPISNFITKLCPSLTITKRDHLPNVICRDCVYKLQVAYDIKVQCEETDKQLRDTLPRAKKVFRRRTDYALIDYESSSGEDAGANDDEDEFKPSDEVDEDPTEPSESDQEFAPVVVKKRGRPRKNPLVPAKSTPTSANTSATSGGTTPRPRGRPRKHPITPGTPGRPGRPATVIVKKEEESSDEYEKGSPAKRAKVTPAKQCAKCKAVVTGAVHQCKGVGFHCLFCTEQFTTHPLYMNHQQLHINFQNAQTCVRCHKSFTDNLGLRKHQAGSRCEKATDNKCQGCGQNSANASQLAIHLRTKCPAKVAEGGRGPGRPAVKKEAKKDQNLFKCVAPPTSTYWSDSFSD